MDLFINGFHARTKVGELYLDFPLQWLPDSKCFVLRALSFSEATKIKKQLKSLGLTVSMDNEVFGSAT